MPDADKPVTLDVFLVTLTIPPALPAAAVAAARRVLARRSFSIRLRAAAAAVLRRSPALAAVTPTVSR